LINKNISILGLGLIGGSLAKAIKNNLPETIISAYDKSEILAQAAREKIIDNELKAIKDAKDSDIIFLSLPTDLSLNALQKLAPILKQDSIITDVSGVKKIFEKKWSSLNSKGYYVGGHPMTGKEKGGYENSDPLLFENAVYILSEKNPDNENYKFLLDLIKKIGCKIRFLNADLHDEIAAKVSHLPQLLSTALLNLASKEDKEINPLDFAAGGFRDMTRIASSNFLIWRSVLENNRDAIVKTVLNFLADFTELNNLILKEDYKAIEKHFENARKKRDEIPKNSKGFIHPLFDIFVFVKDEPGVLSKITTALFQNSINIKDIELLKIREGTGGTFRFSLESKADADKASGLIQNLGFKVK
jgi:prephenate dehydrogenase